MNSWLKIYSTSILLNMIRALECFNSSLLPFFCHIITSHYLIISLLIFTPKLVIIIITICSIALCFSYPIILILNFIAIKYPGLLTICFLYQIICSYSEHCLDHYFSIWSIFSYHHFVLNTCMNDLSNRADIEEMHKVSVSYLGQNKSRNCFFLKSTNIWNTS